MTLSCIHLFPQAPDTIIRDARMRSLIIKSFSFSIGQLIESLHFFYIVGDYHRFDPHVGETACQIRAYQLLQLVRYKETITKPMKRIQFLQNIRQRLNEIEQGRGDLPYVPNHQLTLRGFVEKLGIYFELTEPEWLLLKLYFLTRFKVVATRNLTFIDFDRIANASSLSRKFAKKLTHYYQVMLAKSSCQAMLACSKETSPSYDHHEALQALHRYDDDGRPVLPCYFFTKALYQNIVTQAFPVVLTVYKQGQPSQPPITLFFHPQGHQPMLIEGVNQSYTHEPCFVISGQYVDNNNESGLDYLCRVKVVGLGNILLSNMAVHPQYSGLRLSAYRDNPFHGANIASQTVELEMEQEWRAMKGKAVEIGCSQENATLFVVSHIYCDNLARHMAKIYSGRAVKATTSEAVFNME